MKRISRISIGLAAALIILMIGLCFTASAQLQPVDVTGPTYDTPNQAFTKLNANDSYLDGRFGTMVAFQIPWSNSGSTAFSYDPDFYFNPTNFNFRVGNNISVSSNITSNYNFLAGDGTSISGTAGNLVQWATAFGEASTFVNNGTAKTINNPFIIGGYLNSITLNAGAGNVYSPFIIGTRNTITNTTSSDLTGTMIIGYRSNNEGDMNLVTGFRGNATVSAIGGFVHGFSTTYTTNGNWTGTVEPVTIGGRGAVNISANSASQTVGHGAYGDYSAILGGQDHDIPSTSARSAIIGGNAIKARGSDPDNVYVPYLNITQITQDDVLTQIIARNGTTGKLYWRAASTIGGGITNTAAANELMKSDGTNAVGTGIFSSAARTISPGANTLTFQYDTFDRLKIQSLGVSIGPLVTTAARPLHVGATSTGIGYPLRIRNEDNVGVPAVGIGTGLEFETETSGSNYEIGATIEAVTTDNTATSEDFKLAFKTMTGGALVTEKFAVMDNAGVMIDTDIRFHGFGNTNVFIGPTAGNFTLTGTTNTTLGSNTGNAITSASNVALIGAGAGQSITSGSNNVGVGYGAVATTTTGPGNVGLGYLALGGSNTTGGWNIAIGQIALNASTGDRNIGIGKNAGDNLTAGNGNIIIGGQDIDFQSATGSNQLVIQNAIFGSGNGASGTAVSTGSLGFYVPSPLSNIDMSGSIGSGAITTITAAATLSINNCTVLADATTAPYTVTLPTASGATRRIYRILKKDASANAVTISTTAGGNLVINTQYSGYVVQSDGTSWYKIGSF